MIFQKQLFLHKPEEGFYGDCVRTVFACLLDLTPEEVPHFAEKYWHDVEGWVKAEGEFLASHGLRALRIGWQCQKVEEVLAGMPYVCPSIYYILGGQSRNGTDHVVIGLNDEIVWDPARDDSGIVGPLSSGQFDTTFFVPLRFAGK